MKRKLSVLLFILFVLVVLLCGCGRDRSEQLFVSGVVEKIIVVDEWPENNYYVYISGIPHRVLHKHVYRVVVGSCATLRDVLKQSPGYLWNVYEVYPESGLGCDIE